MDCRFICQALKVSAGESVCLGGHLVDVDIVGKRFVPGMNSQYVTPSHPCQEGPHRPDDRICPASREPDREDRHGLWPRSPEPLHPLAMRTPDHPFQQEADSGSDRIQGCPLVPSANSSQDIDFVYEYYSRLLLASARRGVGGPEQITDPPCSYACIHLYEIGSGCRYEYCICVVGSSLRKKRLAGSRRGRSAGFP